MYDTILIATDGSDHADNVVDNAIELASRFNATLHAIYVVDRSGVPTTSADMRDSIIKEFEEVGDRALADIQTQVDATDIDLVTQKVEGNPSEEILEYTDANNIDLIVMGTHGRRGLQHVLMGSVAEKVVRDTTVPVHLIRYQ